MSIFSIAIQKGGSGKTTTAINLAAALLQKGKSVLLVDADPQASLSEALGIIDEPEKNLFTELSKLIKGESGDLSEVLVETRSGLHVIPSSIELAGAELELVGMLTDDLTLQGGATYESAEVTKSLLAANVGRTLANFANFSASLQVKYRITDALQVGAVGQYVGKRYGGQPDTAAVFASGVYSQPVPAYGTLDLFASYKVNPNLGVRLNVNNVFDRDYFTASYRGGFFVYKGDARNARITLDYDL